MRGRFFDDRNARFAAAVAAASIICGALIRARILFLAPFVSESRALWFAVGLAEDVAFAGALVLIASLLRGVVGRAFAMLAAIAALLLHFGLSELVIAFGHPFRAEDLQAGLHPVVLSGSVTVSVVIALVLIVSVFAISFALMLRRIRRVSIVAVVAATLVAFAFSFVDRNALSTEHPLFTIVRVAQEKPISQFKGEVAIPAARLDPRTLRELSAVPRSLFYDDAYPLAHRSESSVRAPLQNKPNIVFLLLEGVRATEISALGGEPRGVTPNLDRLVQSGTAFANAYSVGGYTPEGELGLWYGLLASPHELVMRTRPDVVLHGLPELLRGAGWRSLFWIHNSDQTLYSSGQFYKPRGFHVIDGRDFAPDEPRTSWGFSDRALMRKAIATLGAADAPFAAMVITISNHHPFALPSDARTKLRIEARPGRVVHDGGPWWESRTMAMLETVHYTDEAIGDFFAMARAQPWFANTIFVIAGDHGVAVAPYGRSATLHEAIELRHHVPIIIWSPLLPPSTVRRDAVSQADVMPSLLALLGINTPRAGTGIDVASPHEHPVLSWAFEARVVTVREGKWTYHAWVKPRSIDIEREMLVDTLADPRGEHDAIGDQPHIGQHLRRLAAIWLDGYAPLIRSGHSGLPR